MNIFCEQKWPDRFGRVLFYLSVCMLWSANQNFEWLEHFQKTKLSSFDLESSFSAFGIICNIKRKIKIYLWLSQSDINPFQYFKMLRQCGVRNRNLIRLMSRSEAARLLGISVNASKKEVKVVKIWSYYLQILRWSYNVMRSLDLTFLNICSNFFIWNSLISMILMI